MKKYLAIACISLMVAIAGMGLVSAGYNLGPGNIFHMETASGSSIKGLWVQGTMSNGCKSGNNECLKYEKQVYARSGAGGTYSDWAPRTQTSITHRDYGAFNNDYAEVRGLWNKVA